ncbi:hypothetical protein NKH69_00095 [Mesorhizobium sp. M0976]|uniref:hypothetical protein n=1 Tax=Mesorhizobium sp. M0976 TaxID=2957038 RepID=UPI00333D9405
MAGTAASYKDALAATRNRSVTAVGGLDIARTIAVDDTDAVVPQATSTLQTAGNTKLDTVHTDLAAEAVLIGAVTETSPATDTASSGLNGRLQRIAQRITALLSATSLSDSNRVPVSQLDGLAVSGSATSAATLFTVDMLGYESITVQVTSAGSSTITYETSDDNTNWVATAGLSSASLGNVAAQLNSTDARMIQFARRGRYFRARVSTYASGTVSVVGTLSKSPVFNIGASWVSPVLTNGSAVTGSNFPVLFAAYTANPAAVANATHARPMSTAIGVAIQKPFSIPEADWSYAAASGGEVATGDIAVKGAAGAGLRNYMTWLTAENVHATVDTEFVVKDGATVIYRGFLKALGVGPVRMSFPSPLKSTANTILNIACITTGAQVYFNCGGYVAP